MHLFILACAVLVAAQVATAADFYVAVGGNDGWSGRLAAADPARTDGPFATIARAQQATRELRKADPKRTTPVVVRIRRGTYWLQQPLVFTPQDGGTDLSPTVYEAYPGEAPVISGGTRLTGWQVLPNGWWRLQLPAAQRGQWTFAQLFVNGERRYRPRLPKDGYYRITRQLTPSTGVRDGPPDRFGFRGDQLRADWPDLQDVEVLVFHSWTMDRLRIKSVDAPTRAVTFTAPTLGNNWFFDLRDGKRFIVENVGAALERPGEWYLDQKAGTLTYVPLPGESPETAEVVAPRLEQLVRLQGEAALGLTVENLQFRDLTFAHTNWVTPAQGWRCGQSEVDLSAAIVAEGARNCLLEGCKVTHVGAYAIWLAAGCQGDRIENCELTDLAGGGVKIGLTAMEPDQRQLTSHNVVRSNLIAHGGRMHAAGMGVWVGHSPFNVIEHNEICDFYQTGISIGWSWGYGPSQAHDNLAAYNRIYHIGQGVTDDMGGIYTLGVSPGTVLHHNVIHDVSCDGYGGRGIYFDEGTSDLLAENNIVSHTDAGAFMQHYGRDNRVLNNIFALARGGQLDRLREEDHNSFTFERNIVLYDATGTLLWENWGSNRYVMDHNLYWSTAGVPVLFGSETFGQWQQRGHDQHSLISDPRFADPDRGDFTLEPGSPASQVGFVPIDMSAVGRLGAHRGEREQPLAPRAFPPKPGPQPIEEDFESLAVGDKTPGATTSEENDQATIRVTDETAATGKHSLKFIDMPGQKYNYNPHLYFQPGFTEGIIEDRFALRVEAGVDMYHEWRDYRTNYRVGPALTVAADGTLRANGRELLKLPLSRWVGLEIACGVGKQATGTYDLTVRLPGAAQPLRFEGIPYDRAFNQLDWYGFTANGTEKAVFYVDDIHCGPRK